MYLEADGLVMKMFPYVPQIKARVNSFFIPGTDEIDHVAQEDIPIDRPQNLFAVKQKEMETVFAKL